MDERKPRRRRKKKPRYDFLNKKPIEESEDTAEMDWEEEFELEVYEGEEE